MGTTLRGTTTSGFDITYDSSLDQSTTKGGLKKTFSQPWADGTGDGQADVLFQDERTGTETLDFTSDLSDEFGTTIVFTKIKKFYIKNNESFGGSSIVISGNLLTAFGVITSITLPPQADFSIGNPGTAGFVVTNTSQDQLTITGGSLAYTINVLGSVQ